MKNGEWKLSTGGHTDQNIVDKTASNEWLERGELFSETDGFKVAVQDQAINLKITWNILWKILTNKMIGAEYAETNLIPSRRLYQDAER